MKRNLKRGIALVLCFVFCFCFCVRGFGVVHYVEASVFDTFKENMMYIGAGAGAGAYGGGATANQYGFNSSNFLGSYGSTGASAMFNMMGVMGGNASLLPPSASTAEDLMATMAFIAGAYGAYSLGTKNLLNDATSSFIGVQNANSAVKYDMTQPLSTATMRLGSGDVTAYVEFMSKVLNAGDTQEVSSNVSAYNTFITNYTGVDNYFTISKSSVTYPIALISSVLDTMDDSIFNIFSSGLSGISVSTYLLNNGLPACAFYAYYTDNTWTTRINAILYDTAHNLNYYGVVDTRTGEVLSYQRSIAFRKYLLNNQLSWVIVTSGSGTSPLSSFNPQQILNIEGTPFTNSRLGLNYNTNSSDIYATVANNAGALQNFYRYSMNENDGVTTFSPISVPVPRIITPYIPIPGVNNPVAYIDESPDIPISTIMDAIDNLRDRGIDIPTQPDIVYEVADILDIPVERVHEITPGVDVEMEGASEVTEGIKYGDPDGLPVFNLPSFSSGDSMGPVSYLLSFVQPVAYFVHDIFLSLMESDTSGYTYAFIGILTVGLVSGIMSKMLL